MTTTQTQEHKTKSATIRLLTPTIIENVIHDYAELDSADIIEIKEINKRLTGGKHYAVLVDSGMMTSITKEGRELSSSKDFQQQTTAKALLIRSLGHRIVGRFYIRVNKPHIRTKIFSDRDKAIQWLKRHVTYKIKTTMPNKV